jgi:hypothetical protein
LATTTEHDLQDQVTRTAGLLVGQWFRLGLQTAFQSRHRIDQWQSSHGVSCPDAGVAFRRDEAGEEVRLASLDE